MRTAVGVRYNYYAQLVAIEPAYRSEINFCQRGVEADHAHGRMSLSLRGTTRKANPMVSQPPSRPVSVSRIALSLILRYLNRESHTK